MFVYAYGMNFQEHKSCMMGVILEKSLTLIMRLLDSYIRILAVNCSI